MASSSGELTVRSGRVKHTRRLATRAFRARTGEFLAEGPQAVREALDVSGVVLEVFATATATERHDSLNDGRSPWHVVDDDVLDSMADAVTPQGLIARCRSVLASPEVLDTATFVVVCADIRDPGNAGAVIRCADAAGADAVVFAGDCVDPLGPKSVRASAGSVFHLPLVVRRDVSEVLATVRSAGLQILAADGASDHTLFDPALDLGAPTAWLMGNEAWGLPPSIRDLADAAVAIPIYGRAESLNLATAAAVCLYATARARHSTHL